MLTLFGHHTTYIYQKINLEKVQKRFLKLLCFRTDNTYPSRGTNQKYLLERFGFQSLHCRRLIASICFVVKLCRNRIDCPYLLFLIQFFVPSFYTRDKSMFKLRHYKTNLGMKSPINVMCQNFNQMSQKSDLYNDSLGSIVNFARGYFDSIA